MSMHLKLLALASAAMLALPVVSYADVDLDLVRGRLGGGTSGGGGFDGASIDGVAAGTVDSFAAVSFSPVTSTAFAGAQVASLNTTPDRAASYGFAIVSTTDLTAAVGLDDPVTFDGTATPFSGTMYLGEALAGYTNPRAAGTLVRAVDRADFRSIAGAGTHASTPEPAPFVLLGAGLLGLGAAVRRRRLHHTAPFEANS